MAEKKSGFSAWWNSPKVQRVISAMYSIGAAVVIVGALFKILHWEGANQMLSIGMFTEAIIFLLGVFDKPQKQYEWDKVFAFDGTKATSFAQSGQMTGAIATPTVSVQPVVSSGANVSLQYEGGLADEDVKKLSSSIKNLSETAEQLTTLSTAFGSTKDFAKNIEAASAATGNFASLQQSLSDATSKLFASYSTIEKDVNQAASTTQSYTSNIEGVNKSLSSINSLYEIQLNNIKAQSDSLAQQTTHVQNVGKELDNVVAETQKMRTAALEAAQETEKYKASTAQLTKQIDTLNQVYGNMLNALS